MASYKRSRKKWKSARAAWRDIGRRHGLSPRDVRAKAHTRTHWVFVVMSRRGR